MILLLSLSLLFIVIFVIVILARVLGHQEIAFVHAINPDKNLPFFWSDEEPLKDMLFRE